MILRPWPDADGRQRDLRWAWLSLMAITLVHFVLGARGGGIRHLAHVGLAALYLVPITLAARSRGAGAGAWFGAVASGLYLLHVAVREPAPAPAVIGELALAAGFVVFGGIVGFLIQEAERRREERDRVVLAARRSEVRGALEALVEALAARDPELGEHSRHVAELAERIAEQLGVERERRSTIYLAGLLHDVGKLALGDDLLFAPGGLDEAQRRKLRDHPCRAADLVRAVGGDEDLAEAVLAHHESVDGGGYPRGLRGAEIPLAARILRVADVFVALTETRRYREAQPSIAALATVHAMSPRELDPAVVDALGQIVRREERAETRAVPGGLPAFAGQVAVPLVQQMTGGESHGTN